LKLEMNQIQNDLIYVTFTYNIGIG